MKKIIVLIGVLLCSAIILLSADDTNMRLLKRGTTPRPCVGFTILEAGKGINCHGDTLTLVKVNGYYSIIDPR